MYLFFGGPREVFWMTEEDRRIQAARVLANNTGTDRQKRSYVELAGHHLVSLLTYPHREWKWDQFWASFRDPQAYLFFFVVIVNAIPTGGTK